MKEEWMFKEMEVKKRREELENMKHYQERMEVIYMWVKQEYITKLMFIRLVEAVQKMVN
jgi:hypothetical protein